MRRIIANKAVEMTNDEFLMYEHICKSYDDVQANRKGEDLFIEHFESNDDGIITFVKPPPGKYTSLEIFCFLISIMTNQHIRINQAMCEMMVKEASQKMVELIKDVRSGKTIPDLENIKGPVELGDAELSLSAGE